LGGRATPEAQWSRQEEGGVGQTTGFEKRSVAKTMNESADRRRQTAVVAVRGILGPAFEVENETFAGLRARELRIFDITRR
jgi:hypothetical protein